MIRHRIPLLRLRRACAVLALAVVLRPMPGPALAATDPMPARPIEVRVVVVTTFELGQDSGDAPGEFQNWVTKLPLPDTLDFPAGYHALRYNPALKVLGIVTGEGPARMASSITALGHDPRFDLSHAYFVLAGIGGIDPNAGSVASVAWAPHVVDGSFAHEIDAREIPADWPNGFTPMQAARPDGRPRPALHSDWGDAAFTIDPHLLAWAWARTRNIALPDTPALAAGRARYTGFPRALKPPAVLLGDTMASPVFWLGARMNAWAEGWVRYWTDGQGQFTTTAEEDAAMMEALTFLARDHRADLSRVLVVRSASNYDLPPPGQTPAAMLQGEITETGFSGFVPSLDNLYAVASPVVRDLAAQWTPTGTPAIEAPAK